MAGKPGMNREKRMGGLRSPAGGRRKLKYNFIATKNQTLIVEREVIGGEIAPAEAWVFLEASEGGHLMTLQRGNELMVIRWPDGD